MALLSRSRLSTIFTLGPRDQQRRFSKGSDMSLEAATAPRAAFSVSVLAFVLVGGIVFRASAQVIEPEAKRTPVPFSQMKITPASLSFKQITFGKTAATESGSLTIRNIGTAPLT